MEKKPVDDSNPALAPEGQEAYDAARILIIDDEDDARTTLKELLEINQYAVTDTNSAEQALQLLEQLSFDLIITDLVMPKVDGIALTKAVRAMGITTPIVVLTGFGSIEYAVESMKAGAADFITKPFNFDQIQIIIKRTLEAKRLAREREYYLNLSNIDELTELNNVRYFNYILDKEIERERRYKRPLSMMMIDIDDFKSYNDTYGHLVGDVLLKQIASLIKKMTRGCDYVARYGGEEFTVVLPETIRQEALVVAERIRSAIAGASFDISGGKSITGITITIGLASFPDDGQDKLELIERADQALYRGKAQGKNRTCVYGQAEG